MKKLRIGIDLDGVCADYVGSVLAEYRDAGITRGMISDLPIMHRRDFLLEWDDLWKVGKFDGPDEMYAWLDARNQDRWRELAWLPGALDGVQKLVDDLHEVVFITARPYTAEVQTWHWLEEVELDLDRGDDYELCVTHDKAGVQPACDIYLDDSPEHLAKLVEAHPQATVVRYVQPWNRPIAGTIAVDGWSEFLALVAEKAEEPGDLERITGEVRESTLRQLGEVRVVDPTTGGEKGTKPQRFDLLPWDALDQVAAHYGVGAAKYADHNWRRGYAWSLSIAALSRHLSAFVQGEDFDRETGSPHMAAVAFHALALLTFMREHPQLDDRYRPAGQEVQQ